jgi:hypothetical protein
MLETVTGCPGSMSFKKELLELLVAMSPVLIALVLSCSTPRIISRWVVAVLITASLAVVATGFSMMRFIGKCSGQVPECGPEQALMSWQPGLIQAASSTNCFRCVPHQADILTSTTVKMNAWTPQISLVAATVCVLLSGVMLVRFARWSAVHYRRGDG